MLNWGMLALRSVGGIITDHTDKCINDGANRPAGMLPCGEPTAVFSTDFQSPRAEADKRHQRLQNNPPG